MREETFIIRWSDVIKFPDGAVTDMACRTGSRQDAEEYAKEIAEKYGVTVEVIV